MLPKHAPQTAMNGVRPAFIIGLFVSTIFLLTFVCGRSMAAETPRPNLIFLLTDDQRFDALGSMGNRIIQTPRLDRLAAAGVVFDNAFCTTSICATSRASFLTGQYAVRHGIDDFATPLSAEQFEQTFPALLRGAGYRTAFVGKWGLGGPLPRERYDFFDGFSGQGRYFDKEDPHHLTDKLAQRALRFLDTCEGGQPFCLQVSFKAAHCQDGAAWQFQHAPRFQSTYADVTIPLPVTATSEDFAALPEFLQNSEARHRWQVRFADEAMFQKSVKDYYRLITGVDEAVGRLVEKLRQRRLADNTVIVFTSDNGFYLGEHGLAGKWFMHEESIRLPLLVFDPRLPAERRGARVDRMALNIDVAPTLLDLAGVEVPETVQGRSLAPLLSGEAPAWRGEFFYEHRFRHAGIPRNEGVRGERFKYVRYLDQPAANAEHPYEELFDLQSDPHERQNLAARPEHSAELAEMRERWRDLRAAAE